MRAVSVVFGPPSIQRGLQRLDALKRAMDVKQLPLQGLMKPLDLPGRRRGVDLGQPVGDAVLPADLVKQHLHWHAGFVEPAGEHLAVVGQHFLGHPVNAHCIHERQAHRPGGGPHDRLGNDAEPGMVIDPGHDLHLGATSQKGAGGHIELPQLHRSAAFPAAIVLPPAAPRHRLDQPVADQGPVDRRAGNGAVATAAHLKHQPPRTPLRMRPPELTDQLLDLGRDAPRMVMDLVAAVLQPRDALLPVAHQPGVHALAADSIPFGDLGHRNTSADFQHGPVSLLGHAQLPQHERECQASSEAKVSSIKRDSTPLASVAGENFPYGFKGARSAPGPAGRRSWSAPREGYADPDAAQLPPVTRLASRGKCCAPERRLPLLGPAGPRRRRRATCPRGPPHRSAPQRSAPGARTARAAILPALQCEAGQDHAQERFASHVMAYGHSCA
jgi:hypothetical protein